MSEVKWESEPMELLPTSKTFKEQYLGVPFGEYWEKDIAINQESKRHGPVVAGIIEACRDNAKNICVASRNREHIDYIVNALFEVWRLVIRPNKDNFFHYNESRMTLHFNNTKIVFLLRRDAQSPYWRQNILRGVEWDLVTVSSPEDRADIEESGVRYKKLVEGAYYE